MSHKICFLVFTLGEDIYLETCISITLAVFFVLAPQKEISCSSMVAYVSTL